MASNEVLDVSDDVTTVYIPTPEGGKEEKKERSRPKAKNKDGVEKTHPTSLSSSHGKAKAATRLHPNLHSATPSGNLANAQILTDAIAEGFKQLRDLVTLHSPLQVRHGPSTSNEEAGPSNSKKLRMETRTGRDNSTGNEKEVATEAGESVSDEFDNLEENLCRGDGGGSEDEDNDDPLSQELKDLEEFFNLPQAHGEKLEESIAPVINNGINAVMNKAKIKTVMERHLCPENTPNLRVPSVNPQVWRMLPAHSKTRDVGMQKTQLLVVKNLIITSKLLNVVAIANKAKNKIETSEITPLVTDLLRIGSALFADLSQNRKDAIRPNINNEFQQLCKPTANSSTEFLFGDTLMDDVKTIGDTLRLTKTVTRNKPGFVRNDVKSKNDGGRMYPSSFRPQFQRGGKQGRFMARRGHRDGRRHQIQHSQDHLTNMKQ